MNSESKRNLEIIKGPLITLIVIFVASAILFYDNNFLSIYNISNILLKTMNNGGLVALGMTFVILAGQIDLSVGSVLAFSGVMYALVGQIHPILGIIAAVLTGLIAGLINGLLVTKLNLSSWIATLATSFGFRGLVQIVAYRSIKVEENLQFASTRLFQGVIPGLPGGLSVLIPLYLIILIVCFYVANHTKYGMSLYAVGGHEESAKMLGVQSSKVKIIAFLISGLFAGLNGMFLASSSGSATLAAGNLYETYAIAMCAIGGVKLTGGEGSFLGTFIGTLIYFIINTVLTYLPISVHWQSVIMGALVLFAVGIQSDFISTKLKWNRRRKNA